MKLPALTIPWHGHHSRKRHSQKSLPTAALPKATLLFSLLSPAVKLLLEIPSCTALPPILHSQWCSALIMGRWLQHMPCCLCSPILFCFHFSFPHRNRQELGQM